MREIWNWIQLAIAAIGGVLGGVLGGLDGFLYALIAFVVIDYITGVMCAVVDKKLSSEVGFRGIFKKILIFCMVAMGHLIDTQLLGIAGDGGSAIRTAVIFFYLANEGISLLENTTRLGLPVPEKLKTVLAQLHNGKSIHKPPDTSGTEDGEYITPTHPEPGEGVENQGQLTEPVQAEPEKAAKGAADNENLS